MRNQNYRVRIKPKVKLKIALLVSSLFAALFALLWFFVNTDYFGSADKYEFRSSFAIEPISIRKTGKYPYYEVGRFKLPTGEVSEFQLNEKMTDDSRYCFMRVFKNEKFVRYQLVDYKNCI